MAHGRRFVSSLVVAGLAGVALAAGPGAGAEQVGPVVAAQDAYVASTAAQSGYDTAELRVRNAAGQRVQSHLRFDLRAVPAGASNLRATLRLSATPISRARGPAVRVPGLPPVPPVSDKLVPREGAWWGSYPGQAPGDVEAREAVYGRQVDILHRYHDWNDVWPTAEERAYAAEGRFLFEGWESRVFGGATMCWADIAAGVHDAAIDAQAQRLTAFGSRLFVGFMHEPEDNLGPCQPDAVNDTKADMGSAEEFRAAWRRIVERVRPVAPNAVWVLSFMGHDPAASWALYPGDDVVDWVAWDPYNWANCAGRSRDTWRSLQQAAQPMYAHLDAVGNTKPRMLGEYGSHDDPAMGSKEGWLRELPGMLRTAMPKVRAVVYFDRVATPVPGDPCAWLADSSPSAQAGFAAAGADSYLNQPH